MFFAGSEKAPGCNREEFFLLGMVAVCIFNRVVRCTFARLGCQWSGPQHKLHMHESSCAHPNKTGLEILEPLRNLDQLKDQQVNIYKQLFDILSYEKVTINGMSSPFSALFSIYLSSIFVSFLLFICQFGYNTSSNFCWSLVLWRKIAVLYKCVCNVHTGHTGCFFRGSIMCWF